MKEFVEYAIIATVTAVAVAAVITDVIVLDD